jgi:hypothetical protein
LAEERSEPKAAEQIAQGLRAIISRVADFFDIFDLSFIVSGSVTLAAISFLMWRKRFEVPLPLDGWVRNVGLIIASYVFGLLCFAMGRWFRRLWRGGRTGGGAADRLLQVLQAHGLSETEAVKHYLDRRDAKGEQRLYVRLWAEVRQSSELAPSFYLLRRYWVMAATYDGMVSAFIVWMLVILSCMFGLGGSPSIDASGYIVVAALVLSAIACSREAGRLVDYQMEELVASVAAMRDKR